MHAIGETFRLNIGDIVYIWNLELGRPEQVEWIGTILEFNILNSLETNAVGCSVLWNDGRVTSISRARLAPIGYRMFSKRNSP